MAAGNVVPVGAAKPARCGFSLPCQDRAAIREVGLTLLALVTVDLRLALAVGERERSAEAVVEPLIGIEAGQARIVRAAVFVIGVFGRERELAPLVVERLAGDEIHRGAQRAFIGVGGSRLEHLQRAEQVGGEYVEVEAAAAIRRGARITGSGVRHGLETIDAHAREIAAQAAHRDAAAFAVVAVQRDAGQSLQRLGQVGVREIRDVLGVDGIHHHVGVLLQLDRVSQRHAVTGYRDLADLLGRVIRGRRLHRIRAICRIVLIGRNCAADA